MCPRSCVLVAPLPQGMPLKGVQQSMCAAVFRLALRPRISTAALESTVSRRNPQTPSNRRPRGGLKTIKALSAVDRLPPLPYIFILQICMSCTVVYRPFNEARLSSRRGWQYHDKHVSQRVKLSKQACRQAGRQAGKQARKQASVRALAGACVRACVRAWVCVCVCESARGYVWNDRHRFAQEGICNGVGKYVRIV